MQPPVSSGVRPLQLRPRAPACRLSVTVPAKDEAAYITATLEALYAQVDDTGQPLDRTIYEVILLANNCTDATAEVARAFGHDHPDFRLHVVERQLASEVAHVGTARRLMMEAAAARLPTEGIICTTDADTLVDRHWVCATLRAFDRGALAVGGRIIVPRGGRTGYRKIYLQDVTYRMLQARLESMIDPCPDDPWPRHFQQYGPSMAVRVDAYRKCGGMPALRAIEDVALGWALERVDIHFVHDPAVKVYTSDRSSDRVQGQAFSHALEEWTKMDAEGRKPVVFGLQHCIQLFKWKVALRRAFAVGSAAGTPALRSLAEYLEIPPDEMERRVIAAPNFGTLYQEFRQLLERTHGFSDAPFDQAIRDLRRFTRAARGGDASRRPVGSAPHAHS